MSNQSPRARAVPRRVEGVPDYALPLIADTDGDPRPMLGAEPSDDPDQVPRWIRRAMLLAGVVVVLFLISAWVFTALSGFWPTLAFAFFIGLAMEPIVNRLERRGVKRGIGTGLVLGGLILGTIGFFVAFGNLLVTQLAELIQAVPAFLDTTLAWVNETFDTELNEDNLLESVGLSTTDLANAAREIGIGAIGLVAQAVGVLFSGLMMLFFAFYFAADGPKLRRTVASWLRPSRQRVFLTVWDISTAKAGSYVISRGILAVISATAHAVFFLLIGLPYWLPLALWVGFVSQFIPTIGTYLAGALPVVIALVIGEPLIALAIVVFVVIYQQVENLFLTPRVTQQTLELHAAIAFGSVIVGGILFGPAGALLAIPVVAIVQSVLDTYGKRYTLVPELQAEHAAAQQRAAERDSRKAARKEAASQETAGREAARQETAGSAPP